MRIWIARDDIPPPFRSPRALNPAAAGRPRSEPVGFARRLADRWSAVGPLGLSGLWADAKVAARLPLGVRVRAATALDMVR